jgi:hypothetical protein
VKVQEFLNKYKKGKIMTSKENALRIIKFNNPEKVMVGIPMYCLCYHGCNHEGFNGGGHDCAVGTKWTDIWGTEWHKEMEGVMGFPRGNPLAESKNLKTFKWIDPNDERLCKKIYKMAKEFPGGDYFLAGSHRDTLWEKSYMLVGMENMMMAFYSEPNFAKEVLHRIMDFQLGMAEHYIKAGVELVALGDDLGTQQGPLLNPKIIRDFFVPEYKRLFEFYKKRNVIICFHSCGNVEQLIETFIELGVDCLNPIQATANDLDKVKSISNKRMALMGGISTAIIMDGPVEKIRNDVKKRILQLGKDGGYFCGADQGLPFPKEHIDALIQAVEEYGKYPLS